MNSRKEHTFCRDGASAPSQEGASSPGRRRPRLDGFDYRGQFAYHVIVSTAGANAFVLGSAVSAAAEQQLIRVASLSRFELLAYCFMPDHIHMMVQGQNDASDLINFVRRFKQMTGYRHKRTSGESLWQQSFFDRVLRRDDDLRIVAEYVFANPVMAGLVDEPGEYGLSGGLYFEGLFGRG